jgi:hypothetical protein
MIGLRKALIAAALIGGGSFCGLLYWRSHREPTKVTHIAELIDNSNSLPDNPAVLLGLAERAISQAKSKSTLTLIQVGDVSTNNEPKLIGTYDIPYSKKSIEGKKSIERQRAQFLSDLEQQLKKVTRTTTASPIFLGLRRTVQQLRSRGCGNSDACSIFVRTDGEETAEGSIKTAITDSSASLEGLPRIDNRGIAVLFCGLAEVNDAGASDSEITLAKKKRQKPRVPVLHDAARIDRVSQVWSSVLMEPAVFQPYCPEGKLDNIAKKEK